MARLFRGPTKGKIFQTIDLGAGNGLYLNRQAAKFPSRKYVSVDNGLINLLKRTKKSEGNYKNRQSVSDFTHRMISKGNKTRYFNVFFPGRKWADFETLFGNIEKVLLPNGKIFVHSEKESLLEELTKLATKYGLKCRKVKKITGKEFENLPSEFAHWIRLEGFTEAFKLEITYGLKKANKKSTKTK